MDDLKPDVAFETLMKQTMEESTMSISVTVQKDRSLNIGVCGVGQAGNKIAKEFYDRGYPVALINTALQDLQLVEVPDRHKLFLDCTLGGTARDLQTGEDAVVEYQEAILEMLKDSFDPCEMVMLVISGGGGTGSGSAPKMVELMTQLGKPVMVMFVLPASTEDTLAKHNAINTLARLSELAKDGVINSLFVVDNARIEQIHPGLSLADFWKVSNASIVEPLHLFNKLSSKSSTHISLDPMDFSRILVGQTGCALYGMTKITNYLDDEGAIAESVVNNLEGGLLAGGFDLSEAKSAGIIVVGSAETLKKIPASNLEYGFACVNKITGQSTRVFRGIYEQETGDDALYIYSIFSGLGLPKQRVEELKSEAETHMKVLEQKEENKANMTIDLGKGKTTSASDQIYNKIKNKSSAMGKIMNNRKVQDLRRKG
jgi:cell division GTPase FtsZ